MTPPLRSTRRLLAIAVLSAAYLGCGDRVVDPAPVCSSAAGTWILASRDPLLGERVLILRVAPDSGAAVAEVPSRAADGTLGVALSAASISSSVSCGTIDVAAQLATTPVDIWLHLTTVADTASGTAATPQHLSPMFGLRVDPAILASADSLPNQPSVLDSTPVLMLRFDDARSTDSTYLPRVAARGLVGELAVPTQLVGRQAFETWAPIAAQAAAGFGVAAHSRLHTGGTDRGFRFMVEVIGSLTDLRAHGYPATVFVQPGAWHDTLNFDSPAKLANWRGALFRNVTRVFEGYEGPWHLPTGYVGKVPLGVTHVTVSGSNPASVQIWFHMALKPGCFSVFLFHSVDVSPPDTLDWLLDSISAAVFQGRLKLATSAADLIRNR